MVKKILIIRKDNVVFTELVDNEEPDLFNSLDDSLNSFKEDQKLIEVRNCLINSEDRTKDEQVSSQYSDESSNNLKLDSSSSKIINQTIYRTSTQVQTLASSFKTSSTEAQSENRSPKDVYLSRLRNNNLVLEQLLDELESLKEDRIRTGKLNYGSKQVRVLKKKLAYFLVKQKQTQLAQHSKKSNGMFVNNEECVRFMNHILDQKVDFRVDPNEQLNSDLNLYLKLNLTGELLLSRILNNLNIDHDSRDAVEQHLESFQLKIVPELMQTLVDLQTCFRTLDRSLKVTLIKYNEALSRYFEILECKEMLKLNFQTNEWSRIETFKMEIKQLHINNLNLANKLNIMERALKRIQSKL